MNTTDLYGLSPRCALQLSEGKISQFYGREGPSPTMAHIDIKCVVNMTQPKTWIKMAYEGANHQLNNTILKLQNCYLTFVVHAQLTFRATVLVHTFLPNFKGKDR